MNIPISSGRSENENKKKLDIILGTSKNLREIINICRLKNAKDQDIAEDLTSIANLSNNLMKLSEKIFQYYLVIPNSTANDDGIFIALKINTKNKILNKIFFFFQKVINIVSNFNK